MAGHLDAYNQGNAICNKLWKSIVEMEETVYINLVEATLHNVVDNSELRAST